MVLLDRIRLLGFLLVVIGHEGGLDRRLGGVEFLLCLDPFHVAVFGGQGIDIVLKAKHVYSHQTMTRQTHDPRGDFHSTADRDQA